MPIRRVQQQSDRGSIRDLANGDDDKFPPTALELRLKELYEHAMVTRDEALINSLGLIPLNGEANNPVSIYRHREYVNALSEELADKIKQTAQEIEGVLSVDETTKPQEVRMMDYKRANSLAAIIDNGDLVKTASALPRRSFRRVIE